MRSNFDTVQRMKTRNLQTTFLGILTIVALLTVFHLLKDMLIPLVIAGMLALMLTPLVNSLKKIRVPRFLAIILVMAALFVVLYIVGQLLYTSLITFTQVFDTYQSRFDQILKGIWTRYSIPFEYFPEMGWTRELIDRIVQVTASFVSFGSTFGLVLLFLVFMLAESALSLRKFHNAFPRGLSNTIGWAVADIAKQLRRYLTIKTLISALTGVLVWAALTIIGQDLAILWGLLAFLLNYIPSLGSVFIMAATMLLGLVQFYPMWNQIIAVWITMPVIQIILGVILDPQLQSDHLDLSPLVILISLAFWGWIWGIVGMFLAVPLTVSMKIVMNHINGLRPISIMMGSGKMSRSFRRAWYRNRVKKKSGNLEEENPPQD